MANVAFLRGCKEFSMKVLNTLKLAVLALLAAGFLTVSLDADAARRDKKEEPTVDYPGATRESPKPESNPRLAKQLQKMMDLYEEGGRETEVVAAAQNILDNTRAKPYDRALALMHAGSAALQVEDYDTALPLLEKVIAENALPNNNHFNIMLTLASGYVQVERNAEAIAMLDRLIAETKSEDPQVYGLKGSVHYLMDQFPQSIEALNKAIQLDPAKAENNWMQMLMAAYDETGRSAEALVLAEQIQKSKPDDKRSLLNLASLYSQADQPAKALALLNDARARGQFTEARDYETLYSIYQNIDGKDGEAAAVLQEGLDKGILKPEARIYTYLAQSLYYSDQIEPAIAAYQKGAPLAADGEVYLMLSQVLTNEEKHQESKAAARQALAKGLKKPGEAWMVIARSEFYLDNLEAAKAAYREAAKDPGTRSQAQKALAQISR
jgi:tetratricopeptide (TPR) repeat protein